MAKFSRKTMFFTVFMSFWLVLAVIFAGVFILAERGHEHINTAGSGVPSGENCRICLEIQIAQRFMEAFGRLALGFVLAGFITSAVRIIKPQTLIFLIKPSALKVKLNC